MHPSKRAERAHKFALVPPISLVISILILIVSIGQTGEARGRSSSTKVNRRDDLGDELSRALVALPLVVSGTTSGEKPRLIPLPEAEGGYSENSSVNLLCSVSQGHDDTLTFDWFKDGQLLLNHEKKIDEFASSLNLAPKIEKHPDHSMLRISSVHSQHSGRYTCTAKNQFGQDSSSVNLIVNVKLQWTKEPPKEIVVSVNQELKVDCTAQGEPKPNMRWEKLESAMIMPRSRNGGVVQFGGSQPSTVGDGIIVTNGLGSKNQLVSNSNGYKLAQQQQQQQALVGATLSGSQKSVLVSSNRYLNIQRARESDAGIYECIASNSHDADLRKLVHVQVRGPPKILAIPHAESYLEGSTINLICTVSAGQRKGMTIKWMMNGQELDEEKMKYSEAFDNVSIGNEEADISIIRIKNATNTNSGVYTCTAANPLGQDSFSVKISINVELKWNKIPKDVEVGLNQEVSVECDAIGSPEPTIEWIKHTTERNPKSNSTLLVSKGKLLRLAKAQLKDSGLYECTAKNGVDEDLRRIIHVKVRGK